MKTLVEQTFVEAPFPDKYNPHVVGPKTFNPTLYGGELSIEAPVLKSKKRFGAPIVNETDLKAIMGFIEREDLARKMVARWFNRSAEGGFDMNLIGARGSYNASEMEKQIAAGTVRGVAALEDAGEELISNTFLVVQKLSFVENEPFARAIRDIAIAAAEEIEEELPRELTKAVAEGLYLATKDGYSAVATAYLFQLQWNDSIAAVFYQDMWTAGQNPDAAKVKLFDETQIFNLKFIGAEKANSIVLISAGRSLEQILNLATVRNIDNVYAKLQNKYDVFKTKTPIYNTEPLTAKIGKKEGLKGGEKFEVLEQTIDSKTGRTKYERKGVITVDKRRIWDNRYSSNNATSPDLIEEDAADEAAKAEGEVNIEVENSGAKIAEAAADSTQVKAPTAQDAPKVENVQAETVSIEATFFKGGSKKYYSGMLLRQIK
jgi:hypothetical protein